MQQHRSGERKRTPLVLYDFLPFDWFSLRQKVQCLRFRPGRPRDFLRGILVEMFATEQAECLQRRNAYIIYRKTYNDSRIMCFAYACVFVLVLCLYDWIESEQERMDICYKGSMFSVSLFTFCDVLFRVFCQLLIDDSLSMNYQSIYPCIYPQIDISMYLMFLQLSMYQHNVIQIFRAM